MVSEPQFEDQQLFGRRLKDNTSLPFFEAVQVLAPEIMARAQEFESLRRMPADMARTLAKAGLYRLLVPKHLGGAELNLHDYVQLIQQISHSDGSAGWCLMIGSLGGALAAWLPKDGAREIFASDPEVIIGGAAAPPGRARPVEQGYLVSGRWQWGSGSQNCSWMSGGSLIFDGERPRLLASGAPEIRLVFYPAHEGKILDTWDASGLRGTGSHDFQIEDLFIPEAHTLEMTASAVVERPLYQFPIVALFALGPCSVALGIARRAIDEFIELAANKSPTFERRTLAQSPRVQGFVAEAQAATRSANAFLHEAIDNAWEVTLSGGRLTLKARRDIRLAAANATWQSAKSVDLVYHAAGGSAVHSRSPLQRCFRDVHTITQHAFVNQSVFEQIGCSYLSTAATELLPDL